ncbi:ABC-F family ATP-binding cassette domain-containing protein [Caulobacter sp. KR2-114]|uniref:ABC-F family ATP-binding cassette domain-containing protein n=1 Tax=Caulobacter sp. KR2-114 TaxID=3400912 RepID=UPI003C032BCC
MPAPLLALRNVRLADGPRQMFDGVDLALEPRARACLVGRNGAGKSTILRMLAGLIQPDDGDRFVTPGLKVGFVLQEPPIEGETLGDYAAAGGAAPHEAEAALMAFDLDPAKSTQGLSGGEMRRAALARAFAEQPDVLLLDEPTNHLDILAIATLEAKIAQARSAVLIVSHDRAFLERVTQQCFWLEDRRVRRLDAGFGKFEDWAAKIQAQEAEEARRLDKAIEREAYWMARGVTARRARNEGRRRKLIALRQEKAERLRLTRGELSMSVKVSEPSGRRVVEAEKLFKAFGDRGLLKGFSTRILAGERVAVVGPNGAGKTTLVKILLGEEPPDSGSVKLGVNLQIAYVDQARADLKPGMTLVEALAPMGGDQIIAQGRPKHVAAYAREFLFRDDQMRQPVSSLSGGERNRLLLARALAMPSNVLVLDEPTNDLDMETLDLLEEILADYEGTLILVSHDRDFIDRLATSTIALDGHGRVVETPGGWGDFLSQNPGFFASVAATAPAEPRKAPPPPRAAAEPAKLSFKDQHRLKTLDELMPKLAESIARSEALLADASLYARDPKAFQTASAALSKAQADLAAAEDEWLALEEKREALQKSRS